MWGPRIFEPRRVTEVRQEQFTQSKYLQRCQVIAHDFRTGNFTMYEDEVKEAYAREQKDSYYTIRSNGSSGQVLMSSGSGTYVDTYQADYGQLTYDSMQYAINSIRKNTPGWNDGKLEKEKKEKAKKHAANMQKCYWAHYQKEKEPIK